MKKLLYGLGALAAVLVLLLAGGGWYLRTAEPDYSRGTRLGGLGAPVEVWRDSLGVPHLWARDEADLYRALGYVHAQDRLWQMELLRRVADGRLAEVLGPPALKSDRFLRTLGMGRVAAEEERRLDPDARRLFEAYAAGVNAWIRDHSGALPPEFVALRFQPEPWSARNSLAIAKVMAWDLADWNVGLDLQRARERVGPALLPTIYPGYPEWGVRILPADGTWRGKQDHAIRTGTLTGARTASAPERDVPLPHIPALAAQLLEGASMARASNSWVIAGSRTRSGKPILANDPHLSLRAPALWYLAALHGGDTEVVGVTIPGVPGVILGRTPGVAWGFTNVMLDDVDFFVEQLHPTDSTRYRAPDGWRRFEVRAETIQVKGAQPVIHRIRTSRHGPVISDVDERAGERVLAMEWTALRPATTTGALLGMNRARSTDDFLRALRLFNDPHQNVVWADADGNIGYWMTGRVPVRSSGDGILPVSGSSGAGDWVRFLDWEEHPHVLNPAEGFIVTANNAQVGPEYPHHIGSYYADPFRAMRIREMIQTGGGFTAAEVARQQMDVRDAFAVRYLPHAVRAAEAAGDQETAGLLRRWNAVARADSRAAAVFYVWYEMLRRRVGDDEYGGQEVFFPRYALNRVLDAGGGAWVDDVTTPATEALPELSAAAMREAVREVNGRRWGELHSTLMAHALGSAKVLERTLELNVGPLPNRGSPHTVNVAGYGSELPFVNTHGASMRHVADMGDPDTQGGFIIPTGQSGLAFSEHYRDQTEFWMKGRLWPIPLDREKAAARAVAKATLMP